MKRDVEVKLSRRLFIGTKTKVRTGHRSHETKLETFVGTCLQEKNQRPKT